MIFRISIDIIISHPLTVSFYYTILAIYVGIAVTFVIIDYLTGIMAAAVRKKLSSEVGFRGIARKVMIFCLVTVGQIIDTQFIKSGSVIRTAVIFFYLAPSQ